MTFLLSLSEVYKCCVYGKNAYNKSLCNPSLIKIQLLMILKKGLLTELETQKKKKKILRKSINFFGGRACFG